MTESLIAAHRRVTQAFTAPGGEFELADAVVRGEMLRVYRNAPQSVSALFHIAETAFGERALIVAGERRLSFSKTFDMARRLGAALRARLDIGPGDHVAIAMRNSPEWIVAFAAITGIGAVAVLVNSRGSEGEIAAAVEDCGCKAVVADARRAAMIRAARPDLPLILPREEAQAWDQAPDVSVLEDLIASAGPGAEATGTAPDDAAVVMFTSGATGGSKGAVLTHRNLATHAMNIRLMFNTALALTAQAYGLTPEDLASRAPPPGSLLVFPLFHTSGLSVLLISLLYGGRIAILPRWRVGDAFELIARERLTAVSGPPMVLADLLDDPDLAGRDLSSLTSLSCGGQATPPDLSRRIAQAFPRASQGVGWGMTEMTGSATGAAGPLFAAHPTSCGPVLPVMDLKIVDDSGLEAPTGEPGEIWARGPLVMQGYISRPDADAQSFEGAWFKSGDIGRLDADGLLYIVDRKKDVVISAGENIYCAEVEQVIAGHPGVLEAAIFGVPDPRRGERAVAAVTCRPGAVVSAVELQALVGAKLADYKIPTEIVFDLGPLPRNALGKIDKIALRRAASVRPIPGGGALRAGGR